MSVAYVKLQTELEMPGPCGASERIPMEKTRRHFTPQQKVAILREHLVEHVPVSDLRDRCESAISSRCRTATTAPCLAEVARDSGPGQKLKQLAALS